MINFKKYLLKNGLRILLHKDTKTHLVAINIIYNVGSRDENPEKTGFAHLFEHLMFGGSKNIPNYDQPLERVGGINNAFTNNDFTNYYLVLPKENVETALWLESDRMNQLAFNKKKLEIQKNVVIEEFNQNYLNQPYGDIWHLLRPMVYETHPYTWPTIGKKPEHIAEANMYDVKDFFLKFYRPNNAIITIAGNINFDNTFKLVEKWFGNIPQGNIQDKNFIKENVQKKAKHIEIERDVPLNKIYKAFLMSNRNNRRFYAADLISDILSRGKSSRLTQKLKKEKQIFSNIEAFITGDIDEGMFVIQGTPMQGVSLEYANQAIQKELEEISSKLVAEQELQKVKNNVEATTALRNTNGLSKAATLSYFELIDSANEANNIAKKYFSISRQDIKKEAEILFNVNNSSTIFYKSKKVKH